MTPTTPPGDNPLAPDQARLTHVDASGRAHMVDITDKAVTTRSAQARALVRCSATARDLLRAGRLPKGDALAVARIAGLAGAKRTADLIPLCHPLDLTGLTVDAEVSGEGVEILAEARTVGRTGVEMEALTAATVAALAVIDMIKGVDRYAHLADARVTAKSGGRSGSWRLSDTSSPQAAPAEGQSGLAAVVTISDRCSSGRSVDRTGPAIAAALTRQGLTVLDHVTVADDSDAIRSAVRHGAEMGAEIIVTTGGTGLGPRDHTPEALSELFDAAVPGLGEAIRATGFRSGVNGALLSRATAGLMGGRLVIALPGSPAAVDEALDLLTPILGHAIDQLRGGDHEGRP